MRPGTLRVRVIDREEVASKGLGTSVGPTTVVESHEMVILVFKFTGWGSELGGVSYKLPNKWDQWTITKEHVDKFNIGNKIEYC